MDEKLNIRSSFPMFRSPIKVKGLDKKNEEVEDRSFGRHLKKDGDKKKKENREPINHHHIDANKQREKTSVDSGMNESIRQNDKYTQIDVLA